MIWSYFRPDKCLYIGTDRRSKILAISFTRLERTDLKHKTRGLKISCGDHNSSNNLILRQLRFVSEDRLRYEQIKSGGRNNHVLLSRNRRSFSLLFPFPTEMCERCYIQ